MRTQSTVYLVTGAAGGIGGGLCRALANSGARLVLAGRDGERLTEFAASLPEGSVVGIGAGDLTEPQTQQALVTIAEAAGVSTLINVAGINNFGLFDQQDPNAIRALLETNLLAPITLTRRLLPHLLGLPDGMVVNVGSTFGSIGYPGYVSYCASKFGLRGFSEALGRELADTPVKVLHVEPRAVRTSMNSPAAIALNQRLGNRQDSVERVATAIVKAISRRARRTGVGWPDRLFAILNQVFPALLDRALLGQLVTIKEFATRD